jgi:hypothetical protein
VLVFEEVGALMTLLKLRIVDIMGTSNDNIGGVTLLTSLDEVGGSGLMVSMDVEVETLLRSKVAS